MPTDCVYYDNENGTTLNCKTVIPYDWLDREVLNRYIYYAKEDICNYIDHIYADVEKRTIVVKWVDGNTTKVKLQEGDNWDLEAGVNAAIVKYLADSHNSYKKFIQNNTTYVVKKDK